MAIEGYRWGNKNGQSIYINQMGDPIREESWRAVNPDNPYDTVNVMDPNNPGLVLRREVVKMEGFSLKHRYLEILWTRWRDRKNRELVF